MTTEKNFFKSKSDLIFGLVSGILVGTSYIPFPPWAILFAYAPVWFMANKSENGSRVFFSGWITQFILTIIGFHWIAYTAVEFGQMPWAVGILALLLFASFMHIYIPLSMLAAHWLKKRFQLPAISFFILIACFHTLLERIWPAIFNWHLGYTLLWAKIPAYHWADVIGFEGLSALILVINALIAWIFTYRKEEKSWIVLGGIIFLILMLNMSGRWHGKQWQETDAELKATIIQANIGNTEKIYAEKGKGFQEEIVRRFTQMSLKAYQENPGLEVFVWPETAFPDLLDKTSSPKKPLQQLSTAMASMGRPFITGAYSRDEDSKSVYNSMFIASADAQPLTPSYRKHELLAFGEYLPLSETFPILLKWLPFVANFGRGPGPQVMDWKQKDLKIGPQICYEGLDPAFTRSLAEQGAEILVNITNDSWFGKTFEPYQHMYMTLARGIEVRRPLIRSTNTGISTAILAKGEVLQQTPIHQEFIQNLNVKYKKKNVLTAFVLWGHYDWVLWVFIALGCLIGGIFHARSSAKS